MKTCQFYDFPNGYITPPLFEKFRNCKCIPTKSFENLALRNYRTEEYYSILEYNLKFTEEVYNNPTKLETFKKLIKF